MSNRTTAVVAAAALTAIALAPVAALAGAHVEYGNDASPRLLLAMWFQAVAHVLGFSV